MFNLSCATHSKRSQMAKKMLSLEEIETQVVLELPDRQLMRTYDLVRGAKPADIVFAAKPADIVFSLVGFGS